MLTMWPEMSFEVVLMRGQAAVGEGISPPNKTGQDDDRAPKDTPRYEVSRLIRHVMSLVPLKSTFVVILARSCSTVRT